jgi:hypothetical protein
MIDSYNALWMHLGTMTMVTVTCSMVTETGNNISVGKDKPYSKEINTTRWEGPA